MCAGEAQEGNLFGLTAEVGKSPTLGFFVQGPGLIRALNPTLPRVTANLTKRQDVEASGAETFVESIRAALKDGAWG